MIEHPKCWHIYIVDLEPRIGAKPGKQRPCLAIQPSEFSEAGLGSTVVLPMTTQVVEQDAFPLRIPVPAKTCGLEKDSDIIVDQILAWDNSLFRKDLGLIPEALQDSVKSALRDFLDI